MAHGSKDADEARAWALQLAPGAPSRLATIMYLLSEGGKSVFPFYEASHVRGRWRAPLLAEPDQTPHITMWHHGCGRLLRCGCAGSMRREGYGRCAGAVVLGYGRSAPLNTAVECSSSPQHRGSKATCRPPSPRRGEKNRKICSHRGSIASGRSHQCARRLRVASALATHGALYLADHCTQGQQPRRSCGRTRTRDFRQGKVAVMNKPTTTGATPLIR